MPIQIPRLIICCGPNVQVHHLQRCTVVHHMSKCTICGGDQLLRWLAQLRRCYNGRAFNTRKSTDAGESLWWYPEKGTYTWGWWWGWNKHAWLGWRWGEQGLNKDMHLYYVIIMSRPWTPGFHHEKGKDIHLFLGFHQEKFHTLGDEGKRRWFWWVGIFKSISPYFCFRIILKV